MTNTRKMDIACIYFTPFWVNLMDDLQKTSCHNLKNEWNWVPSNVPEPLAYAHINLSAFGSMNIHFPSEKLILPYFSSPRGVTTSVPFLEVRIKKGLRAVYFYVFLCTDNFTGRIIQHNFFLLIMDSCIQQENWSAPPGLARLAWCDPGGWKKL